MCDVHDVGDGLKARNKLAAIAQALQAQDVQAAIAETKRAEDEKLIAYNWPTVASIEDLAKLADVCGLSLTERNQATHGDVLERALNVAEGRRIEELQRARFRAEAERAVRAEEGRAAAIQSTPQATPQSTPQAMTSGTPQVTPQADTNQADNTAIATSPSRRVRLLAWRNNRYPSAIVDGLPVPMTDRRHALIRQIIVLQQTRRVTKDDLDDVAGNGRSMLKRMAEKSPWRDVIHFPDSASGNGYRIV